MRRTASKWSKTPRDAAWRPPDIKPILVMPRCQRGFSPSVRGQALSSELAVHVQDHGERCESRRFRAQYERTHRNAQEAVLLRAPAPPLRSRLAAAPLEPDDRALRRERHDARRSELGGLLDYEIHLLAFRQRLDENGIDAAALGGQRLPDLQLVPGEHGAEPPAAPVEHLELRSALQAKDGDEMARLLRSQLHAR